jgi:F0F1-type ATP synthase delta subunit
MNLAEHYAQALYDLTAGAGLGSERITITEKLIALLERKGHTSLLPKILQAYEMISTSGAQQSRATLTVSRISDVGEVKVELKKHVDDVENMDVEVDDTLIGGFIYNDGDIAINSCHKQSLLNLYREIIA